MCSIGKKMYDRRKELGLTLEEVGDAVGVGKSTVRRWENGMIRNMGRDKISALARVLQMDPVEFVPADDPDQHRRAVIMNALSKQGETGVRLAEHLEAKDIGELYLSLSKEHRAAAKDHMLFLKSQEEEKKEE